MAQHTPSDCDSTVRIMYYDEENYVNVPGCESPLFVSGVEFSCHVQFGSPSSSPLVRPSPSESFLHSSLVHFCWNVLKSFASFIKLYYLYVIVIFKWQESLQSQIAINRWANVGDVGNTSLLAGWHWPNIALTLEFQQFKYCCYNYSPRIILFNENFVILF